MKRQHAHTHIPNEKKQLTWSNKNEIKKMNNEIMNGEYKPKYKQKEREREEREIIFQFR